MYTGDRCRVYAIHRYAACRAIVQPRSRGTLCRPELDSGDYLVRVPGIRVAVAELDTSLESMRPSRPTDVVGIGPQRTRIAHTAVGIVDDRALAIALRRTEQC